MNRVHSRVALLRRGIFIAILNLDLISVLLFV